MRVLLVRHYRPDRQRSMLQFGQAMLDHLKSRQVDVLSIEPKPRLGKGKNTMAGKAKLLGYLDKFVLFPRDLRAAAKSADLVHLCGQQHALYIKYLGGKPSLLTCHDLLAMRAAFGQMQGVQVGESGQKLQRMIQQAMPQATHIACVSTATQNDLAKMVELRPGQSSVVLNGVYEWLERMPVEQADEHLKQLGISPQTKYLFHIGGNQFYKNRPGLVRIFRHFLDLPEPKGVKLVMAGRQPTPQLEELVEELRLEDDLIWAFDVSFEEKVALYTKAIALVFPSTAEGFGLPVIEAQMCGCPVVTSDLPPMDEVALGSALLIDPHDEAGSAIRIASALGDLPALVQKGFENVQRFRLDRMGDDYIRLYERLLA